MEKFIAEKRFFIGKPVNNYVSEGEVVEYDGRNLMFRGHPYVVANINSAIKANWLMRVEEIVEEDTFEEETFEEETFELSPKRLAEKTEKEKLASKYIQDFDIEQHVDRKIPIKKRAIETEDDRTSLPVKIENNFSEKKAKKRMPIERESEGDIIKVTNFKEQPEDEDDVSFYEATTIGKTKKLEVFSDQYDPTETTKTAKGTAVLRDAPKKTEVVIENIVKETSKSILPRGWNRLHYKTKEKSIKETTNMATLTEMKKYASPRLVTLIDTRIKEL